ncbi:MAG TPA: HU family DNA-binding protein [Candidatus Hydrogenedentes bacterium]|nr:HU family DNA-binding protein [Candidatus Hydrogenedentota bacterium]HOC71630.1 HU family DNA-binding protein [Candidatus Hydrogenedentota bacterium]HOH50325.1 HU family DNA-binding protein [Candidatus Hydrogenedentota bacterium]HPA40427.1 HU family DNA-binding protein [Candidatus Hydrogenedentota bacterium]HQL94058.1 HU family DNA-binding protein [Candidatus Hydrogenedentota bacterium]
MTKRELVIEIADKLGFTQGEVAVVVQAMLDTVVDTLARGDRLEVRNFGVFETKSRNARSGRNPRTGASVSISRKRVVTFKPGKAIKELVDAAGRSDAPETDGQA